MARLRCAVWPDPDDSRPCLICFIGEQCQDLGPSLIEDGPVQSGLLFDVHARLVDGASSAAGHVLDLQGFGRQRCHSGSDQCGAGLVGEVVPAPGLASFDPRDLGIGALESAAGPTTAWCSSALARGFTFKPVQTLLFPEDRVSAWSMNVRLTAPECGLRRGRYRHCPVQLAVDGV